jgi:ElaB/YqjD/DUF883 family membrane-anchored ribosome-binding protein
VQPFVHEENDSLKVFYLKQRYDTAALELSKEKDNQLKEIEDLVKSVRKDVDTNLAEVKAQLNIAQRRAAKTVAERPMLALGVAFVAGMALGILLSKSSD